jgi:hypothetical protein
MECAVSRYSLRVFRPLLGGVNGAPSRAINPFRRVGAALPAVALQGDLAGPLARLALLSAHPGVVAMPEADATGAGAVVAFREKGCGHGMVSSGVAGGDESTTFMSSQAERKTYFHFSAPPPGETPPKATCYIQGMSDVSFDTHAIVKDLLAAGFTDEQAEAVTRVVKNARTIDLWSLATKADLIPLASKADMTPLATKIELAETKAEIIKWMVSTIGIQTIVIIGAVIALVRMVPHQ